MTAWLRQAVLTVLLGAAPALAAAQEHPPLIATRDATVQYQVQGGHDQAPLSVRVHVSGGKLRVEPASLPGTVIVDRGADRAMMVLDQQHAYFAAPLSSALTRDFLLDERMDFIRRGSDRVAGQSCTVWDVQAPQGRTATVCVAPDGIVLRGRGHDPQYGEGSFEAVSITYARQPASLFQPPPGYQRLDIPRLLSGFGDTRPPR